MDSMHHSPPSLFEDPARPFDPAQLRERILRRWKREGGSPDAAAYAYWFTSGLVYAEPQRDDAAYVASLVNALDDELRERTQRQITHAFNVERRAIEQRREARRPRRRIQPEDLTVNPDQEREPSPPQPWFDPERDWLFVVIALCVLVPLVLLLT